MSTVPATHPFNPDPQQITRSFGHATMGFLASTLLTSLVMVVLSAL
jgi:hypothetical protein